LVITNKVQDILRRDADIAVRMARPTQPELLARKIGETKLGIYAHRDWLAAHGTPASLEALVRGRGMVGYDREDTSILRALASRGVSAAPSDFCFRSDSDLAQLAAIRAGIGAGACQIKIADRDPNLMRIAPEQEFALEIWLAVSAGYRSVARLRVVFEALARELRVYGSPD
jgi:DNA-binding transcriptional LysR family regulator